MARRHEELAGSLRRRRHQHRRLHLDEALSFHRGADRGVDLGADAEVALHPLAAHIEVPVAKPHALVDVVGALVDGERRRLGDRQHLDSAITDLDVARGEVWVRGAVGTWPHRATHPHDVLRPEVRGAVDDALHEARVIAHVDEREVLAVLAPPRRPIRRRRPAVRRRMFGARRNSRFVASRELPLDVDGVRHRHRDFGELAPLAHWCFLMKSTSSRRGMDCCPGSLSGPA